VLIDLVHGCHVGVSVLLSLDQLLTTKSNNIFGPYSVHDLRGEISILARGLEYIDLNREEVLGVRLPIEIDTVTVDLYCPHIKLPVL